jgi:hypothetical protein
MGMRIARRRDGLLFLLGAIQLGLTASSQAAEPAAAAEGRKGDPQAGHISKSFRGNLSRLVNSELLAAVQAVASQNQCISYVYDHNGNITTKTDFGFGATATWGSSTFGCFSWTAP